MIEYWKYLWIVLLGWEPGTEILAPFPAALFIFLCVFTTGLVLYHMTKAIVPEPFTEYVLEFVKTMTFVGYPAGHVIVYKGFGVLGIMVSIALALMITSAFLKDGAGNPLNIWVAYFESLIPLRTVLLKNIIQIAAAFSAYHFSMFIISAELSPLFTEQLIPYNRGECVSHLNVPVIRGFLIEFAGSFYIILLMYQKLFKIEGLDQLFKVFNIVIVVILGIRYTGMHVHPAKASGLTWGCGSTPKFAHILVYWIAPFLGTWLATKASKIVSTDRRTKSQDKKTENGIAKPKQESNKIQVKGKVRKRKT